MKKKNKSNTLRILMIITIILIILLIFLVLFQFNFFDVFSNINKEPQMIKVKDECSLIFNQLLHQIKDEGSCKVKCETECSIRQKSYYSSGFLEKNDSCNLCTCYCK
jgi:hypothetical protein